jgi:arylsulfatase A-like enzyme
MKKYLIFILVAVILLFSAILISMKPHQVHTGLSSEPFQSAVLITIDTLRGDHLGFMGNPSVRSPALDRLAQNSLVFGESYCNMPITLPAHSAMMTSRFPRELGLERNSHLLHPDDTTLTEILKRHGFATAAYPQAILQFHRGLERGFDFYDGRKGRITGQQVERLSFHHPDVDLDSQNAVPRAVDWISERESLNERYYLWMHFFEPHIPYNPPDPYRYIDQYASHAVIERSISEFSSRNVLSQSTFSRKEINIARTVYRNEIFWVDTKLEALIRHIETTCRSRPFIIVTSDHGEVLHDRFQNFFHGYTLCREELHVPLLIFSNGRHTGVNISTLVQSVDVAPTILNALDIPGLPDFRGRNILNTDSIQDLSIPFSIGSPPRYAGAMDMRYKVVTNVQTGTWQYWDRAVDYAENHPLEIQQHSPQTVRDLQTLAADYLSLLPERAPTDYWDENDSEFMQLLESLGYIQ